MIPKNRVCLAYALMHTQTHKHTSTRTHTHTPTHTHTHTHRHTRTHAHICVAIVAVCIAKMATVSNLYGDPTFRRRCLSFQYKCDTAHFPQQETATKDRPIKMHSTGLFTILLNQLIFIATTAKQMLVITCRTMTVGHRQAHPKRVHI